jgi:cellulose synthase/poly-beta-1,6-N-acetylglucosamine synthase-like glycosyltransferase
MSRFIKGRDLILNTCKKAFSKIKASYKVASENRPSEADKRFIRELRWEAEQMRYDHIPGCLAHLVLYHYADGEARRDSSQEIKEHVFNCIKRVFRPRLLYGPDSNCLYSFLIYNINEEKAQIRLNKLNQILAERPFEKEGKQIKLTPALGYTIFLNCRFNQILNSATEALAAANKNLDLQAVARNRIFYPDSPKPSKFKLPQISTPGQIALTFILGLILPYFIYGLFYEFLVDISFAVYVFCILFLLITVIFIWIEGFLAMQKDELPPLDYNVEIIHPEYLREPKLDDSTNSRPPEEEDYINSSIPHQKWLEIRRYHKYEQGYPPASAIIAAYLPNEEKVLPGTLEAFFNIEYPNELQIILAYNTPEDMAVEGYLAHLAEKHPNFLPLRINGSTSKAQNVNAAMDYVKGEFTAIFDADHQPDPNCFKRAWHWLANGYDIVQGHCLIRNGHETWVSRMIAVEFETIYTVSHPGRARLHGYGIFGGSNGYWKTELLFKIRMHGSMLTEDIDSSLRAVEFGYNIKSDPLIISRELAPAKLQALWKQRLRWAQGWFQVSLKHIRLGLKSPHLTFKQKVGLFHLLGWREAFVWVSIQILPILFFWIFWKETEIDWFVPILVIATLFIFSTGPGQVIFTYINASPEIKKQKKWFIFYFFISLIFYTGFKNLISRLAQIKELFKETGWNVTSRL